jgi:signal transduction histidine kinase/ligand-binding sensor domain-containing protein
MAEDQDGNLWLSTQEKGIYFLDLKNKRIVEFFDKGKPPYNVLSNNIFSVLIDSKHEVWAASDMGVNRINMQKMKNTSYVYNPQVANSLSHQFSNYIYEDDHGNIWVSTDGGGLNLFDRETDGFIHFKHNKDDETSLLGDKTNLIFKNRQDQLWVASIGRGINYTNLKNAGSFKTFFSLPSSGYSVSANVVTAIVEDAEGNLWIGTDGGGLDCYVKNENRFTHYKNNKNDPNSLPSNSVTALYVDSSKALWVGTFQGGLSKFNFQSKSFSNYLSGAQNTNSISGYSVFAISEDKYGNIIAGGHNSGINILDKNNNTVQQIYCDPNNSNSLASNYILSFYTDSFGDIWIGTYRGLSKWDQNTKTFTNYYHNDFEKNSLSHDWVYCIAEDKKQNLWIGTASGLNLFDKETKQFKSFSKKDGFSSDVINGIIEDENGNLWLSTNGGLVIFNPETKNVKNIDESYGLPGDEFMKCAYYKGINNVFYFGNTKGLVYFLPDSIKTNTIIPPIHITDFYIMNSPVPIGESGSPLERQIIETKELKLKYNQTYVTFKYVALNYESPEKNQYAYMLEGFDDDWHYVGNERKATYTSLDAGKYTFRVKGSNNDGVWNDEGASLKIIVLPPWWETWWFRFILFFSLIASIVGFYYYRISSLRKQKQELELNVLRRTDELKKSNNLLFEKQKLIEAQKEELMLSNEQLSILNATKDKLFSVLGHDLKAPFNVLIGFGDLLLDNIDKYPLDKTKEMLACMSDGIHSAYEMLENLLNWARSQRGAIKVYPTEVNITLLIESVVKVLNQQALAKQVNLHFEVTGKNELVLVDEVLIGTILRNIVSNSIKFSKINSQVKIEAKINDQLIEFAIRDQGVGMPHEIKEKLFKVGNVVSKPGTGGEKGTGLGLLVCAEFISLFKGHIWVESELNVGTTFFFTIPI